MCSNRVKGENNECVSFWDISCAKILTSILFLMISHQIPHLPFSYAAWDNTTRNIQKRTDALKGLKYFWKSSKQIKSPQTSWNKASSECGKTLPSKSRSKKWRCNCHSLVPPGVTPCSDLLAETFGCTSFALGQISRLGWIQQLQCRWFFTQPHFLGLKWFG